jgi:hypothetical protein
MPKFVVRRRVDAWVNYTAEIEAEDAEEAAELAQENDDTIDWTEEGVDTFDDRRFITLDGEGHEIFATEVGDKF